jgi:hypothetical protein
MNRLMLAVIAMSLGSAAVATAAVGTAELSLPTVKASAGGSVVTSIKLQTEGTEVSALTFDVQYDPSAVAITPVIGSSALAADKVMFYNVLPQPDGTAYLRILIFGLNQTAIEDGSLVDLMIEVNPNSPTGAHPLDLVNVSLATPDAQAVPFKVHSGRIVAVR